MKPNDTVNPFTDLVKTEIEKVNKEIAAKIANNELDAKIVKKAHIKMLLKLQHIKEAIAKIKRGTINK